MYITLLLQHFQILHSPSQRGRTSDTQEISSLSGAAFLGWADKILNAKPRSSNDALTQWLDYTSAACRKRDLPRRFLSAHASSNNFARRTGKKAQKEVWRHLPGAWGWADDFWIQRERWAHSGEPLHAGHGVRRPRVQFRGPPLYRDQVRTKNRVQGFLYICKCILQSVLAQGRKQEGVAHENF